MSSDLGVLSVVGVAEFLLRWSIPDYVCGIVGRYPSLIVDFVGVLCFVFLADFRCLARGEFLCTVDDIMPSCPPP